MGTMKTTLVLVRHAEAEGNVTRVFHGWTDGELTAKGHIQAKRVADRLLSVEVDILYSSSLKRTLKTAGYIAETKKLPIIRTDKLKEINGGDWEGKAWDDLPVKWPDAYDTWENQPHVHRMPNGETMEEFQHRLIKEIMYIIHNHLGKNICIVTHGTAIKALMCYFRGCCLEEMINIPWYDNTAVSVVVYEDGCFHALVEGDASHLDESLSTIGNQEWFLEYQEKFGNQKDKEI